MGLVLADGVIATINNAMPANQLVGLGKLLDEALSESPPSSSIQTASLIDNCVTTAKEVVTPFVVVGTLTAVAAAAGVILLADAAVPSGKKVYVTGFRLVISGATAWTDVTATKVSIQDSNGSPVSVVDVAKAGLTGNAIINGVGGSNQTVGTNVTNGTGLTASKGIVVKGDANFGAGSDIFVHVFGVIK